jgi:DNA-binding LacI/PurR family transcriptional regulator
MAESDSFWPPLTTVHQDFDVVGRLSLETLIREIESGPGEPTSTVVPTRLVTRSSTAPRQPSATL